MIALPAELFARICEIGIEPTSYQYRIAASNPRYVGRIISKFPTYIEIQVFKPVSDLHLSDPKYYFIFFGLTKINLRIFLSLIKGFNFGKREMAAGTNIKRLQNEMIGLEERSDRCISPDKYYIISLSIPDSGLDGTVLEEVMQDWGRHYLCQTDNQPMAVYVFYDTVDLIFSCTDVPHFLGGSHQKLCSYYVSSVALNSSSLEEPVDCRVIEMESQTQVFTYYSWKIFNNSRKHVQTLSKTLTSKDVLYHTSTEIEDTLKGEGVEIESLSPHTRFGTIYSLKRKKGKVVISELSELFDTREMRKYLSFIFG